MTVALLQKQARVKSHTGRLVIVHSRRLEVWLETAPFRALRKPGRFALLTPSPRRVPMQRQHRVELVLILSFVLGRGRRRCMEATGSSLKQ